MLPLTLPVVHGLRVVAPPPVRATGVELRLHEPTVERMRVSYSARGMELNEARLRMVGPGRRCTARNSGAGCHDYRNLGIEVLVAGFVTVSLRLEAAIAALDG